MGKSTEKKNKYSVLLNQMCEVLTNTIDLTTSTKLHREFEAVLRSIKSAQPQGGFEIKRLEKTILGKLKTIARMVEMKDTDDHILNATAEIGLLLVERSAKCEKNL